jgi:succinate dehydrogenase flavin-adding protein (antitoxin of CptAB toxin-antitoxin module)
MRELDELLRSYLERQYDKSSAPERAAFESLLELPDPVIADYLLGAVVPTDPVLAGLTARLARPERAAAPDAGLRPDVGPPR